MIFPRAILGTASPRACGRAAGQVDAAAIDVGHRLTGAASQTE